MTFVLLCRQDYAVNLTNKEFCLLTIKQIQELVLFKRQEERDGKRNVAIQTSLTDGDTVDVNSSPNQKESIQEKRRYIVLFLLGM